MRPRPSLEPFIVNRGTPLAGRRGPRRTVIVDQRHHRARAPPGRPRRPTRYRLALNRSAASAGGISHDFQHLLFIASSNYGRHARGVARSPPKENNPGRAKRR